MKNLTIEQICVSNFPYYKYSLEYALDSLERMGGKYLEMYACDPHFHVDDCTLADARALKLKIKNHGLTTMCFTPEQCNYPVNIAAKNPVARKRSIDIKSPSSLPQNLTVICASSLPVLDAWMRRMRIFGREAWKR